MRPEFAAGRGPYTAKYVPGKRHILVAASKLRFVNSENGIIMILVPLNMLVEVGNAKNNSIA